MRFYMSCDVLDWDICGGLKQYRYLSPVACAIKRYLHERVYVAPDGFMLSPKGTHGRVPMKVVEELARWYKGERMKPFSFVLKIYDPPLDSYGVEKTKYVKHSGKITTAGVNQAS